MIELKQKTKAQIKKDKQIKEEKKSIIKNYLKTNNKISNLNLFSSDEDIYNNLKKNNKKQNKIHHKFKKSIPVLTIIGISLLSIIYIFYLNFDNISKSKIDTFVFIYLIVSFFCIALLIILKNIFIDPQ